MAVPSSLVSNSVTSHSASEKARINVRAFTLFRVCFAARFYYPVFAILFLDHGLSLAQFGLLNAIWAATIVLLEVPSGALADLVGRRNLLILAGILMLAEMVLLIAAPSGGGPWTFWLFALNRLCSGAAEAAASGADEALMYDSLKAAGEKASWGRVLERVQRDTSLAFFFALLLGAAVYDARMVNAVVHFLGWKGTIESESLIKLPILLNLLTAPLVLFAAFRMNEVPGTRGKEIRGGSVASTLAASWVGTVAAAKWIWRTPMAFVVIFAAMLIDSVIRQYLTLSSEYWRVIQFPVASFGLIGSAMALLGLFTPVIARNLSERVKPVINLVITCSLVLLGLLGLSMAIPYWGIAPAALLYAAMQLTAFFVSRYLHEVVPSGRRATVLSFRGLSTNLAYGLTCILYPALVLGIERGMDPEVIPANESLKDLVFVQSLAWFPVYFLFTLLIFLLILKKRSSRSAMALI